MHSSGVTYIHIINKSLKKKEKKEREKERERERERERENELMTPCYALPSAENCIQNRHPQ